jgi:hypothetical protein
MPFELYQAAPICFDLVIVGLIMFMAGALAGIFSKAKPVPSPIFYIAGVLGFYLMLVFGIVRAFRAFHHHA